METKEEKIIDVEQCARCGYDHASLQFKEFANPIQDSDGTIWNWFTYCPVTNEPILMKISQTFVIHRKEENE